VPGDAGTSGIDAEVIDGQHGFSSA
jgi:hypothetical protein